MMINGDDYDVDDNNNNNTVFIRRIKYTFQVLKLSHSKLCYPLLNQILCYVTLVWIYVVMMPCFCVDDSGNGAGGSVRDMMR